MGSGSRQGVPWVPLTVPCWVGQGLAGQAIGGKRPEPRGWVDWARWAPSGAWTHISSRSCFSPAPDTESQPENRWGRSWRHYWDCSQCDGELSGFMRRKGVEGFSAKDIHIFPGVNVTFITSSLRYSPPEGRGSSLEVGVVAQPCLWAHRGRSFRESHFLG